MIIYTMTCVARCLVASLSVVILAVVCLPSRAEAHGLPQPRPDLNFIVAVEGMVWCKSCPRYESIDASPLPNAVALLQCQSGNVTVVFVRNTTDSGGNFLIRVDWQSAAFNSKDCKVKVEVPRSPAARGCTGADKPNPKAAQLKFRRIVTLSGETEARYSAGNFTFSPKDSTKC